MKVYGSVIKKLLRQLQTSIVVKMLAAAFCLAYISACGGETAEFSDFSKATPGQPPSSQVNAQGYAPPQPPGLAPPLGFFLGDHATRTLARIEGCASGFSRTYEWDTQAIQLYKGDRGCQGKILQFELAGELYSLPEGSDFNATEGAVTSFVNSNGDRLSLQLVKALPAVVDDISEGFVVHLVQLEKSPATQLVIDQNIFTLTATLSTLSEGLPQELLVTLRRVTRRLSNEVVTVQVAFGGDATYGVDYEATASSFKFNSRDFEKQLRISLVNDTHEEADELISISIKPSSQYVSYGQLSVLIHDNDGLPFRSGLTLALGTHTGLTLSTSTGRLTQWYDQSGLGLHGVQDVPALQPSVTNRVFGNLVGVGFKPATSLAHLELPSHPSLASAGPYLEKSAALVIATARDVTALQALYYQGNDTQGYNLYTDAQRLYFCIWAPPLSGAAAPIEVSCLSQPVQRQRSYVVLAGFNATTGQQWLRVGSTELSKTWQLALPGSEDALARLGHALAMPSHRGLVKPSLSFKGFVGALYLYNVALTNSQRHELATYLTNKFDI